jgi:serine protease inhibitor
MRQGATFKPDFLARNQKLYGANISALDFDVPGSVAVINDWVARSTNRKIPTIIDRLAPDDVLVLINAVYFKAAWAAQFNPSRTSDAMFYLSGGARQKLPMMNEKGEFQAYSSDGVVAVSLPYTPYGAQMELFMPAAGSSITRLLRKFDYDSYRRWKQSFEARAVTLRLPRVKLQCQTELSSSLQALGMQAAFTAAADFSGMTSAANLLISGVIHKTTLELDENGTEASAATSLTISPISARRAVLPLDFIANRPFLVVITDSKSGAILFMGIVMNPQPGTR